MYRRAALLAADDEADRIARVVQRVEHGQVALARHAEGELDAVDPELVDQDLGRRCALTAGPGRTRLASRKTVALWVLGFSASAGST